MDTKQRADLVREIRFGMKQNRRAAKPGEVEEFMRDRPIGEGWERYLAAQSPLRRARLRAFSSRSYRQHIENNSDRSRSSTLPARGARRAPK